MDTSHHHAEIESPNPRSFRPSRKGGRLRRDTLVLRKELFDRLAARRSRLEWQRIVDDLADLSEIDVEQDGRRARLRTAPGPTIDPICRALGLTLPPVFQEAPPAA